MKIAIVGASRLTGNEEADTRKACGLILNQMIKEWGTSELIFISGGASGVDTIAETTANGLGIKCEIYKPTEKNWDAYKVRNIKIAESCDVIYCLPTKVRIQPCYHCDSKDHERSGGCYTAKHAKSLKKEVHIVPLI
jgi:hypothetical protein